MVWEELEFCLSPLFKLYKTPWCWQNYLYSKRSDPTCWVKLQTSFKTYTAIFCLVCIIRTSYLLQLKVVYFTGKCRRTKCRKTVTSMMGSSPWPCKNVQKKAYYTFLSCVHHFLSGSSLARVSNMGFCWPSLFLWERLYLSVCFTKTLQVL